MRLRKNFLSFFLFLKNFMFFFYFLREQGRNKRKKEEKVKMEPGDGRTSYNNLNRRYHFSSPAHPAQLSLQYRLPENTNICCEWVPCGNQWRYYSLGPSSWGQKGTRLKRAGWDRCTVHRKQADGVCAPIGPWMQAYTNFNWISEERVALAEFKSYIYHDFISYIVHKQS